MEGKVITYIEAGHIRPHPENPRKDLGDLSELVESIRKNGVLQNLTVIPVEGEPGEYMTLIGHRRYAAGIRAGVEKFPCRIAENLTPREQVSIMLEENIQRNDLTIWEQANGFQMILDLGETEDSIAEKTGFSRTTVRHRLNIAKLNQKVLQEKEKDGGFQLSLKDLYELEKIPDVKARDKILKESTSSNNLAQKARSVAGEIRRKEREKAYIRLCKAEGIKPAPEGAVNEQYSGKWEKVKEFDLDKDVKDKLGCKTQAAKEELFYVVWWRTFTVIKKKGRDKKEPSEHELQQTRTLQSGTQATIQVTGKLLWH
ncbi:MAG: ParB/RepB/Spo0J family partition protein, partial [Lachnospiraceae bacterium]|nr:ParB/RepB/Spo0J family partition protein [Lachnospiraceae bacterium]